MTCVTIGAEGRGVRILTTGRLTMGEQENAAIGRQFFTAWNERDFDTLASLFSDDAEVVDLPSGETFRGPEGAREEAGRWAGAFPDGKVEIRNSVAGTSGVVVEGELHGTNTGPLQSPAGEIPATNRSVEMPFVIVWDIRNGQVNGHRGYYDSATLMRQLGLMAEAPAGAAA
jgi:steroid delta-isomerase-like uncharacterized protein